MRSKYILPGLVVMAILFIAPSCKKCIECTKFPGGTEKLCKKDYASDDSYASAFRYLESEGYDCE